MVALPSGDAMGAYERLIGDAMAGDGTLFTSEEGAEAAYELFKRWCSQWLWLHLILSVLFYGLLALHVGSGIYFGLRWLR